jgi:hypothetical protein
VAVSAPAAGQGTARVTGRVVDPRGAGVAAVPVTFHAVLPDVSPLVASDTTDAQGGFLFVVSWPARAEDAHVFVSTVYRGVRYTSPRLPARADSLRDLRLTVYDTTLQRVPPPTFGVAARRLFVQPAGPLRAEVVDAIEVANRSDRTWVSPPDTGFWRLPLPEAAQAAQVAESELGPGARMEGNALSLHGPLPPGTHPIVLRYFIPIGTDEVSVPLGASTQEVEVLLAESLGAEGVDGLDHEGSVRIGAEPFRRYVGSGLGGDAIVRLSVGRPASRHPFEPVAAALTFLLLVGGTAAWRMRRDARLAARTSSV